MSADTRMDQSPGHWQGTQEGAGEDLQRTEEKWGRTERAADGGRIKGKEPTAQQKRNLRRFRLANRTPCRAGRRGARGAGRELEAGVVPLMRGEGREAALLHRRARALLGTPEPRGLQPGRPGPRPVPPRAAPKACFPAPAAEAVPGAESGCLVPRLRASSLLHQAAELGVATHTIAGPLVLRPAPAPPGRKLRPQRSEHRGRKATLAASSATSTAAGDPPRSPDTPSRCPPSPHPGRPPGLTRLLPGPGRLPERAPLPRGPRRSSSTPGRRGGVTGGAGWGQA